MMRFVLALLAFAMASNGSAQEVPDSTAQIQLSFAPVVRQAAPAVVNIYARVVRQEQRGFFRGDPFFERFFRDFGSETPRVQNSLGSGVILTAGGIVVSNYHVVGDATDIRVVLADRREFAARVLLGDAASDLAILQLEGAEDLPFLSLRASDSVEVGELVLAIGNPFGVGQTVSSGIVSGLARSGAARGQGRGYFIQTDAPINPGNSGGALVGMGGRLIGINTSILTRSGGSNGIGFAIPADLVATFVEQAQQGRREYARPWAGMRGQTVDADMASAFGLPVPGGVIVAGLHPASPFSVAGVIVGDVITAVDGQPVNTPSEMLYRISVAGIGNRVSIDALRAGQAIRLDVNMIEAPDVPARNRMELGEREILSGLVLERINPAVIVEMGLPLESSGVVVTDPGRLGRRVGLRRSDVIEAVNDLAVAEPRDVADAFSQARRNFALTVQRNGRRLVLRFGV